MMSEEKIPFNKALLWILLTTLFISGSAFTVWLYYLHIRERRLNDDQYRIVAIVQTSSQSDALKTVYLAELLNLSLDKPVNLYQFNAKEATDILLNQSLIKKASVKKILPGTLLIDYEMRVPVAYLGEFSNSAIDEKGIVFPFRPFFTPKSLPTFYLGLDKDAVQWGTNLKKDGGLELAFDVMRQFEELHIQQLSIKEIDVTQSYADSYGQRQIVLTLDHAPFSTQKSNHSLIYLRLNTKHYEQDLLNFRTFYVAGFQEKEIVMKHQPAKDQTLIVDLRIPHLAFIKFDSKVK